MIDVGEKLNTDFEVRVVRDGAEATVKFADLLTRRTIVSVYMRNNTSACDVQVAELARSWERFDRQGYNVVAISRDTCRSHQRYAEKMGVGFTLVSDPEFQFAKAADSMVQKSMYGRKYMAPSRSAYILDTDGTVLAVIEKVDPKRHAEQLQDALAAL